MSTNLIVGLGVLVGAGAVAAVAMVITAPARRRKRAVDEALRVARDRLAADPGDADARVSLGRVLLEIAKRPDEATVEFEAVLAANPLHWAKGEKPTRSLLADAIADTGKLTEAIAEFKAFVDAIGSFETGGDSEKKWELETHRVEAEQRIRLLERGDTHVHRPEQWGDAN